MNTFNTDFLDEKYPFSASQMKLILESIPANVFFKDMEGRYQVTSHICEMLNSGGSGSIIGKTDLEVQPDPALGRKFYEEDMEIIRTGQPMHYLQEMVFDGISYYYDISKTPVYDSEGNLFGITGIVTDMTENISLQKQLREFNETDPMTGVRNRTYYNSLLNGDLPFPFPIAVIMADCNQLKQVNDTYGHECGDKVLLSTVQNIQNVLGEKGKIIRLGGDEFLIIVPDCDEAACISLIEQLHAGESSVILYGRPLSTAYGYTVIGKEDHTTLSEAVDIADKQMYKAKEESRNEPRHSEDNK